ncbi:MAG: pyruvate, phosphate dikinase [Planctomycetes bacterium]|nr:pyruvate, phosphate dikinase [Planctomycetota bacterium]
MSTRFVYFFGRGKADGNAGMKHLLGGKGANLAEMTAIGLPVPPGFTISTEVCDHFWKHDRAYPRPLAAEVEKNLTRLEAMMGRSLGDPARPLLVSVRSGAAASMPGMMDTILNLGLNDAAVEGLAAETGNPRFAWDAYRRFIQMFGDVACGVDHDHFERLLSAMKERRGARLDTDLRAEDLRALVTEYKAAFQRHAGFAFPQAPREQLWKAIDAVFSSWNTPRAVKYREISEIRGLLGTAVNVQSMVFGNMGADSGTGVCFTRNPSTGDNAFYGEYLMNAQGEDVVAGIRTPEPIAALKRENARAYRELVNVRALLERHYRDMQDIEFTIQKGELFILQTRNGKRTGPAAVRIAVDLVKEKTITVDEALMRVNPADLDQLLHPTIEPEAEKKARVLARGLPAAPGAARGRVFFTAEAAEKEHARVTRALESANSADKEAIKRLKSEADLILVRHETSPEDIGGMNVAQGILTARGGMTSHAAVVARGLGKCCVAGAGDVRIDSARREFTAGGAVVKEGEFITLNGSAGAIYLGRLETCEAGISGAFSTFMKWADSRRRLEVWANADKGPDAAAAVRFGAQGIGLTRTEHMFFDNIVPFRRLILVAGKVKKLREEIAAAESGTATAAERQALRDRLAGPQAQYDRALADLLPFQRSDFEELFTHLAGRPVTIRLLDPPLHEFVPQDRAGRESMARDMGASVDEIQVLADALHEANPMLGHRGCRLGLTYPEVSDMQVRAIMEAAINVKRKKRLPVKVEIMFPLVGHPHEMRLCRERAQRVIDTVFAERKVKKNEIPCHIGTMIEVPRACVAADEIARHADFFSFGTNDLTQMGCGFSRDDAGAFLGDYVKLGVYDRDPFRSLDQAGVGRLMQTAVTLGRLTNARLKLGICGEHGGDPASVRFCHDLGLDYVSCSPYRVPIARHAAAQAAIAEARAGKKKRASRTVKRVGSRSSRSRASPNHR